MDFFVGSIGSIGEASSPADAFMASAASAISHMLARSRRIQRVQHAQSMDQGSGAGTPPGEVVRALMGRLDAFEWVATQHAVFHMFS